MPVMGILYVVVSLIVVIMHIGSLPHVFGMIFKSAFNLKAIFGGFTGSCIMWGIKRGLYSNEAGMGSAPNAAAAADVAHPAKQGLVQMLSVFIDTLLICSATAFMCLFSGVEPSADAAGAAYVHSATLVFRLAATFLVFLGAVISAGLAWDTADLLQALMVLINVPVILILAKPAVQALKDYENQRKAGKEPTYNAEQNGITGTDFWRG